MLFEQPISTQPFNRWFLRDRENRRLLLLGGMAIILQFIVFKFFYPYPNFMPPDSYSYLDAAYQNLTINMWAIGYSKFLRLFSSFTISSVALVWFQYLLLQISLLYFLFSVRYLLAPKKWVFRVLLGITILNPLMPHISNFIGSDTLFTALSLIWFTQLLWILYSPNLQLLLWHSLVLLLAFMVRYNALYFPLLSMTLITFAHLRLKIKAIGIATIIFLIGGFIVRTEYEYYRETKTIQFSAFGGWQIAANALYGYAYALQDDPRTIPTRFRNLQALVNHHMDSLNQIPYVMRPDKDVAVYYLWDFKSPLRVYMERKWSGDTAIPYFNQWASMAPLYASYGRWLILHHSISFIQYYIWPNFIKYYVPPTGFMGSYNLGNDHVDRIAVIWFKWPSNKINQRFNVKEIEIAQIFPVFLAIVNLVFVLSIITFAILKGFKKCSVLSKRIIKLIIVVWISNMLFSVVAAPIELRYQLFPMVITVSFTELLLAFLISEANAKNSSSERLGIHLKDEYQLLN